MGEALRVQRRMIWKPLQGGVGADNVILLAGGLCPSHDVAHDPLALGKRLTGGFEHRAGAVQSSNLGLRPAIGEDGGAGAGARPQIDDAGGIRYRDSGDQVPAGKA